MLDFAKTLLSCTLPGQRHSTPINVPLQSQTGSKQAKKLLITKTVLPIFCWTELGCAYHLHSQRLEAFHIQTQILTLFFIPSFFLDKNRSNTQVKGILKWHNTLHKPLFQHHFLQYQKYLQSLLKTRCFQVVQSYCYFFGFIWHAYFKKLGLEITKGQFLHQSNQTKILTFEILFSN